MSVPPSSQPLLAVHQLVVGFPAKGGRGDNSALLPYQQAVCGVSFALNRGEVLGLVGESGCGKSLTSLAVLNLVPTPGKILEGSVSLEKQSLLALPADAMRKIRGARIALIPQDPMTSLNPVYTIGNQLLEVITLHRNLHGAAAEQVAIEALDAVKVPNAKQRLTQYPHEFSGGMRQRVMIAMALACEPDVLIADEPTTALDVTVQAQILALIKELQAERGMGVLLITHDLGVVAQVCHRVAVMYAGRIVEEAPVKELFSKPSHPYTQSLLAAIPNMKSDRGNALQAIEGQPPPVGMIPHNACAFAPRCSKAEPRCTEALPPVASVSPNHTAQCVLV